MGGVQPPGRGGIPRGGDHGCLQEPARVGLERYDEITTRSGRDLAERDSTRSPPCVGPTSSTDRGTRSTQHVPPRPTPLGAYGPFDNLCACVFIWCETMMR